MTKEEALKILDKHIDKFDKIIYNENETSTRKFVATSAKSIVESIKEDFINAEDNTKENT